MKPLSLKQREYLDAINSYIAKNDNFPMALALSEIFNVYPNCAQQHLEMLERKGYIERTSQDNQFRRTEAYREFLKGEAA